MITRTQIEAAQRKLDDARRAKASRLAAALTPELAEALSAVVMDPDPGIDLHMDAVFGPLVKPFIAGGDDASEDHKDRGVAVSILRLAVLRARRTVRDLAEHAGSEPA